MKEYKASLAKLITSHTVITFLVMFLVYISERLSVISFMSIIALSIIIFFFFHVEHAYTFHFRENFVHISNPLKFWSEVKSVRLDKINTLRISEGSHFEIFFYFDTTEEYFRCGLVGLKKRDIEEIVNYLTDRGCKNVFSTV